MDVPRGDAYRSHRAVEKLREHVSLTATTLRDSEWKEIPRKDLVPGDLVRLAAGDLVPADGELLESRDLFVQQGALTGESLPVEKNAAGRGAAEDTAQAPNLIFLGTSVVSGSGVARIVATGGRTTFGAISAKLGERVGETKFERGLRHFGLLITRTVLLNSKFETGIRSPLDTAILARGRQSEDDFEKCDEIPFDFNRRRLSIIVRHKGAAEAKHLLITKGAPEGILALCDSCETDGQQQVLDSEARLRTDTVYKDLCRQGFRVFGGRLSPIGENAGVRSIALQLLRFSRAFHADLSGSRRACQASPFRHECTGESSRMIASHVG